MSIIPIFLSNVLGNTNPTANVVTLNCNPPIDLSNDEYYCGLVSCSINYCNPNIINGKNSKFVYGTYSGGTLSSIHSFDLETGLYSLQEIQNSIQRQVLVLSGSNIFAFSGDTANSTVYLYINQTTGTIYGIDLNQSTLLNTILGFTQGGIISGTTPIQSQNKAYLNTLSSYIISCDFVNGSFNTTSSGLIQSNIIYSVVPDVETYSQITRNVENVLYAKVNRNRLESITVSVLDQNLNDTDFTNGNPNAKPEPFNCQLLIVPKKYLFKS